MLPRRVLLALPLLLAALPSAMHPEDDHRTLKALSPEARRWVDTTMAALSTGEKIGQIVFPTYFGGFESTESQEYKELMTRVERDHIGGFILGTRRTSRGVELSHVYETAVLTNQLQRAAKYPLLIGADFERGTVMRVEEGTPFPHAMGLGATGRPEDAYAMGRITAIEGRAIGVPWVFAPVADVNSNPDNPIINIRSFGEDPKRVAEYVTQFVRGVEENGGLATAKHFPGHGDTAVDSHLELPLVKADRARLNAVEFVPFEAAIAAGASSVMTAHLAVPALEPSPDTPATFSERVLTGVLRDEMHFDGLVVTDALDMGGVIKGFPPGEAAVRALAAGADVLLLSPVTDAALTAVRDALESGRIPMSRLDDAVHRLLVAKARLGLYQQREVDLDKLNGVFRRPEFVATAQDIADRGVTLLRNDHGLVPLDPRTPKRIFLLAVSADPDTNPAEPFERELRSELDTLDSLHVDTRYFRVEETHLPPGESYDLAICALTVRVADRKATVGLPPNEAELVHSLLHAGKPVIMAGLGSPYLAEGFPEATTWLSAFSIQDVAQRAAARALLGDIGVTGKLPVSLPGAAPHALHVGDGLNTAAIPLTLQADSGVMEERLRHVFELLDRSVQGGTLRGGVLAVSIQGRQIIHPFGQPNGPKLPAAMFVLEFQDMPVLTTAIARLVELKQLSLDTLVSTVLQGSQISPPAEGWRGLTIKQILEHTSKLEMVPPQAPPLTVALRFADVSASRRAFPFADSLIELATVGALTGESYLAAAQALIFAPLSGQPVPGAAANSGAELIPPDPEMQARNSLILGQLWMNGGIYAHKRLLSRKTLEQFRVRKQQADAEFTAGWEVASAPGHLFSSGAFGFTVGGGPSLWIDPAHELCVVFLPNAGKPVGGAQKDDAGLEHLRAEIHDAIHSELVQGR